MGSNAQELIQRILRDPTSPDAQSVAERLLGEFRRGYQLDALRPLLLSSDDAVAKSAAWIASELGPEGQSLLDDIATLLVHSSKRVRFYAIDCILSWASSQNAKEIAAVFPLINDSASSVRWKAMDFVTGLPVESLQAAYRHLASTEPNSAYVKEVRRLI